MKALRALSFTRPWTELVLTVKDVENRSWPTHHRGLLVVHGAKSWDPAALALLDKLGVNGHLTEHDYDRLDTTAMYPDAPTGYLGVVEVVNCHPARSTLCWDEATRSDPCSPWAFDGSWHWALRNPRRFPEPIPGGGKLGLWRPPPAVAEAVRSL